MARERRLRVVSPERPRVHPVAVEFDGGAVVIGEILTFAELASTHPEVRPPLDELTIVPGIGYVMLRLWPKGVNGSAEARAEFDSIIDGQGET